MTTDATTLSPIKPYKTENFLEAFWLMVEEMGADYYDTEMFVKPYKAMLSYRGKKYASRRSERFTPEERTLLAFSGVYFNVRDTKGPEEALNRIIKKYGPDRAPKLVEVWESSFRGKNKGEALRKMKNT